MFLLSLPMRERGLKFHCGLISDFPLRSLPMRGRGLKCSRGMGGNAAVYVAPHAGGVD